MCRARMEVSVECGSEALWELIVKAWQSGRVYDEATVRERFGVDYARLPPGCLATARTRAELARLVEMAPFGLFAYKPERSGDLFASHDALLERIHTLTLKWGNTKRIAKLICSASLKNLRVLESNMGLRLHSQEDLKAMLKNDALRELEVLVSCQDDLTPNSMRELSLSRPWGGLHVLRISASPIGMRGLKHMLDEGSLLRALTTLELSRCEIGPGGMSVFSEALHLGDVKELGLSHNRIGDEGLCALIDSAPRLTSLRRLDLSDCGITPKGVAALVESPLFERLEVLDLRLNRPGKELSKRLEHEPHVLLV